MSESWYSTQNQAYTYIANISTIDHKPRQLETPSTRLPYSLHPFAVILEEVDKNEITLDDNRLATEFPPSSPNISFSSEFDDPTCGTVDHMDVTYKTPPTVTTTRIINTPPP